MQGRGLFTIMQSTISAARQNPNTPGLFTLALRLIVGWTYFSAFWRRVALENKLDPEAAGYIGEKFNHFLPHALGIKPLIEYLVLNPDALWWSMVVFTIIEGVVGLLLMLGLFTRAMGLAVFGLALGILLGSGWIGTTCLDEWQIGILGLASGFTFFLSGSGHYSVDHWLMQRGAGVTTKRWFPWMGSGPLELFANRWRPFVLGGSLAIFALALFTNQVFHGGVWGTLHNKSVRPQLVIERAALSGDTLTFTVQRVQGADVYGSFLVGMALLDAEDRIIAALDGEALAKFPAGRIHNHYVAKIRPGKHSMVLPLGAKADIHWWHPALTALPNGALSLRLTDISGATWQAAIER